MQLEQKSRFCTGETMSLLWLLTFPGISTSDISGSVLCQTWGTHSLLNTATQRCVVNRLLSVQSVLGSHTLWEIAQWALFCSLPPCIIRIWQVGSPKRRKVMELYNKCMKWGYYCGETWGIKPKEWRCVKFAQAASSWIDFFNCVEKKLNK